MVRVGESGRVTHDFATCLRASQEQADAPWWEEVYRHAFPDFATMSYVGDCPAQRDGVDRVVVTSSGHNYKIDEKVRIKDYKDFFLEFWSVKEKGKRSWIALDLAADFIAYAFVPSRRCYLLPFPPLRLAWRENHREWVSTYGEKIVPNQGYTTRGVAVPIPVVMDAIRDAFLVTWTAPDAAASIEQPTEMIDGFAF